MYNELSIYYNMKVMEKAARLIKQSERIIIGAGAGMGKDSGMPDFRGN